MRELLALPLPRAATNFIGRKILRFLLTIQGLGAFATRRIPSGTRLIEYTGERLTPEQADERYPDTADERHHTYLFAIDDDVVIDDGRIWIETIREVEPGEELAYDYAYVLEERHTPSAKRRYPCTCGAANCRGTILTRK